MTLRMEEGRVHLVGSCAVEEAEPLATLLLNSPDLRIDVSRCESMHAAVAQVLLALRPSIEGAPHDPFMRNLIKQVADVE